jgi:21S rRNA (GM2251-2'-O)-methyltransferase
LFGIRTRKKQTPELMKRFAQRTTKRGGSSRKEVRVERVARKGRFSAELGEYLYSLHPIRAALLSRHRKLATLYVDSAQKHRDLCKLASGIVPVREALRDDLDARSGGRPHQGAVLDCSPLPINEAMSPADFVRQLTHVNGPLIDRIDDQNGQNDQNDRNVDRNDERNDDERKSKVNAIALDRIQDPQNLGAICRSAAYFGVTHVLFSSVATCMPTPAASAASAGALELLSLWRCESLPNFLQECRRTGHWHVVGADRPSSRTARQSQPPSSSSSSLSTMLVLGNEATGLHRHVRRECDAFEWVPQCKSSSRLNESIESLNVSVAAGILMNSIFTGK